MPTSTLSITVLGDPVPKGRPRFARTSTGHVRTYTPQKTTEYESRVALAAQGTPLLSSPLCISINFYIKRPKALKGDSPIPHTKRPDLDNLVKAVLDGLKAFRSSETVTLSANGATTPVVLTPTNAPDQTYLIMPVQIRN